MCERVNMQKVKTKFYILLFYVAFTTLLSFSCDEENSVPIENIFEGFTNEEISLLNSIAPEGGGIANWIYENVSTQTQSNLQWEGFIISFAIGKEGDNVSVKYSTKLPASLEGNREYQTVWPLSGYFSISEINGRDIQVQRFIYESDGIKEDTAFTNGVISLSENGNRVNINFTINSPTARTQGIPVSTWTFVLERPTEE